MLISRFAVSLCSAALAMLCINTACAADYPDKPIRAICTAPPGGGLDFIARLVAPGLSAGLGKQVVVDNRGGANGAIGSELAAKSPPDGYTLLFVGNNFWTLSYLKDQVPYNAVKDFTPITLAVRSFTFLVVHPSLPVKSVSELIALAKAKPGQLTYATGSNGSSGHLAAELFKSMAGVNIVHVPYKGNGPAIVDLLGGQVNIMFADGVANYIKSGRLKALAITTATPSAMAPDLPTVAASGLPGFEVAIMYGVLAPAGTPPAIVNRLNREFVKVLNGAEVKERFFNNGSEVVASSPQQYADTIKTELAKWSVLIKNANIRAD